MEEKGIILEIRKNEAVIVNNRGQYKRIKKISGMFLGQMVNYNNKAMVPNKVYRYMAAVSGAAALLIFVVFSSLFFMNNLQPKIFAYIDIDINPSMEFSIDENERVISLEPLNSDAEKTIGSLHLKGININNAVSMVIEKLEKNGFIAPQKKNLILISSSSINKNGLSKVQIESNNSKLNKTVIALKESILKRKSGIVFVKTIHLPQEVKKPTKENKISIGRYVLYKNAIEKGVKITQDEAKRIPLNELIEKTANKDNVEIAETDSKSEIISVNTDKTKNDKSNISDIGNKNEETLKEDKENNIDDKEPKTAYENRKSDDKKPKPAHEDRKSDDKKPKSVHGDRKADGKNSKESVDSVNKRENSEDKVKNTDERVEENTTEVVTDASSDIPESTSHVNKSTPTPAEKGEKDKKPEHNGPKGKVQPEEREKGNTDSPINKEKVDEKNREPLKLKPEDKENMTDKPTPKPAPKPEPKPEPK